MIRGKFFEWIPGAALGTLNAEETFREKRTKVKKPIERNPYQFAAHAAVGGVASSILGRTIAHNTATFNTKLPDMMWDIFSFSGIKKVPYESILKGRNLKNLSETDLLNIKEELLKLAEEMGKAGKSKWSVDDLGDQYASLLEAWYMAKAAPTIARGRDSFFGFSGTRDAFTSVNSFIDKLIHTFKLGSIKNSLRAAYDSGMGYGRSRGNYWDNFFRGGSKAYSTFKSKYFNLEVTATDIKSTNGSFVTKAELKKLYRQLTMKNHPDRGGNEQIMKEIIADWEKIKGSRAFEKLAYQLGRGNYFSIPRFRNSEDEMVLNEALSEAEYFPVSKKLLHEKIKERQKSIAASLTEDAPSKLPIAGVGAFLGGTGGFIGTLAAKQYNIPLTPVHKAVGIGLASLVGAGLGAEVLHPIMRKNHENRISRLTEEQRVLKENLAELKSSSAGTISYLRESTPVLERLKEVTEELEEVRSRVALGYRS